MSTNAISVLIGGFGEFGEFGLYDGTDDGAVVVWSVVGTVVPAALQACSRLSHVQAKGCYRYFPKVSPIFNIDAGFKSIVDTDIDTLP